MQVHLSRPGGQREGPYTVEQINRDLADRKYRDTDYWAWYEGLETWVPLHSVPGVVPQGDGSRAVPETPPMVSTAAASVSGAAPAQAPAAASGSAVELEPEPAAQRQVSSGMPFKALKQLFIFTSGEGPATMQSPLTSAMFKEITGEDMALIRETIPRDVFGRCDIGERLRQDGKVPDSAWRAMSALKPAIVQQARDGVYRICVRTFNLETGDVVAVFLFYEK
jgi:hypothetical protein